LPEEKFRREEKISKIEQDMLTIDKARDKYPPGLNKISELKEFMTAQRQAIRLAKEDLERLSKINNYEKLLKNLEQNLDFFNIDKNKANNIIKKELLKLRKKKEKLQKQIKKNQSRKTLGNEIYLLQSDIKNLKDILEKIENAKTEDDKNEIFKYLRTSIRYPMLDIVSEPVFLAGSSEDIVFLANSLANGEDRDRVLSRIKEIIEKYQKKPKYVRKLDTAEISYLKRIKILRKILENENITDADLKFAEKSIAIPGKRKKYREYHPNYATLEKLKEEGLIKNRKQFREIENYLINPNFKSKREVNRVLDMLEKYAEKHIKNYKNALKHVEI